MSLPLISLVDSRFILNEQAKCHLLSLGPNTPVGVLSIVGKYRTGKSFFLNNVIFKGIEKVFREGPTINPCTKGVWIGKQLIQPDPVSEMKIIVLDVEGFGIIDDQEATDSRIFLFPLLLSSYLLYNSVGNITEEALRLLGILVNLAREVQLKSHRNETGQYFPAFHWILRDFVLSLEDTHGKALSPRQYLEKALECQKGLSEVTEQKNRVRRNFKEFFVDRDCSTLLRPTHSDQDTDTAREFRSEFLEEAQKTRARILSSIRPKYLNGVTLTIATFVELAQELVHVLNSGDVPNLELAWRAIYTGRERAVILDIQKELTGRCDAGSILSEQSVSNLDEKIRRMFLEEFQRLSLNPLTPSDEVARLLKESVAHTVKVIMEKIKDKQRHQAEQSLVELYREIEKRDLNSVKSLNQELCRVRLANLQLVGQVPFARQIEIESKIRIICLEKLSGKLEELVETLKTQNQGLQVRLVEAFRESTYIADAMQRLEGQLRGKTESIEQWKQLEVRLVEALTLKQEEIEHLDLKSRSSQELIISIEARQRRAVEKLEEEVALKDAQITAMTKQKERQYSQLRQVGSAADASAAELLILRNSCHQHQTTVSALNAIINRLSLQAQARESQIAETEERLIKKIDAEETRLRATLKAGEARQKEKDLIIEKLERILKEVSSRRGSSADPDILSLLKVQLGRSRSNNELLGRQLSNVTKQLEKRTSELHQMKSPNTNTENVKSSLMNVGLTSSGFEVRSFKTPPSLKQSKSAKSNHFSKIKKVCLDAQATLQVESLLQSQKLLDTLLERQRSLIKEIDFLRQSATNRAVLCDPKWASIQTEELQLSVPVYFVVEGANGRPMTNYQISLRLRSGQQWTVQRRFKDLCDLRNSLIKSYPLVQPPDLYRDSQLEARRKGMQEFLKACIAIGAYRSSDELKQFLCDMRCNIEFVDSPIGSLSCITDSFVDKEKGPLPSKKKPGQHLPRRQPARPLQPRQTNAKLIGH